MVCLLHEAVHELQKSTGLPALLLQAPLLMFNTGEIQPPPPHGALPSWKAGPAPTAPLLSQVTQGHLWALHSLFLFWSIWTTTGCLKAWHLVCTERYFLVIQNPIHNLKALLPGSLNWIASFHFVLFRKTKWSFHFVMIVFLSLVSAQFLQQPLLKVCQNPFDI